MLIPEPYPRPPESDSLSTGSRNLHLLKLPWTELFPPNSHIEALIPEVVLFGDGASEKQAEIRSRGWGLHDEISALIRRDARVLASSLCPVRTQQAGGCLPAEGGVLTRHRPCWLLGLGSPASRALSHDTFLCISKAEHGKCLMVFNSLVTVIRTQKAFLRYQGWESALLSDFTESREVNSRAQRGKQQRHWNRHWLPGPRAEFFTLSHREGDEPKRPPYLE